MINKLMIRKKNLYEKYIKRGLDIAVSFAAILLLSPVYLIVALVVRVKLGSPVIFCQYRPGMVDKSGNETIFKMRKFRTMTDEKDDNGELLPDEKRLTKFGGWLRSTSLDELPELFNILDGSMSLVGPRPQLVRDMVFMTDKQRMRHTAKPGLTGLAQVNGRNGISWEDKLTYDLEYIEKVSFLKDLKIVFKTFVTAVLKKEGINREGMATDMDFGDYLLKKNEITAEEYEKKQELAKEILRRG